MFKFVKKYEALKNEVTCYRAFDKAYEEALKQALNDGLITNEIYEHIRTNRLILAAKYIDEEIRKD